MNYFGMKCFFTTTIFSRFSIVFVCQKNGKSVWRKSEKSCLSEAKKCDYTSTIIRINIVFKSRRVLTQTLMKTHRKFPYKFKVCWITFKINIFYTDRMKICNYSYLNLYIFIETFCNEQAVAQKICAIFFFLVSVSIVLCISFSLYTVKCAGN